MKKTRLSETFLDPGVIIVTVIISLLFALAIVSTQGVPGGAGKSREFIAKRVNI